MGDLGPVKEDPVATAPKTRRRHLTEGRMGWALAGAGLAALVAAAAAQPSAARSATGQDWPPFILVAGLLLIGLAADDDGLFAAVGHRLAWLAPDGVVLYVGAAVLV
jgi:hypothetical protein